jgi:ABC-type glycerol-3-phosphate transport system permease component
MISSRVLRDVSAYGVLGLACVITLAPFVWLAAGCLKNTDDFVRSVFLPAGDGLAGVAWDRLTLESFRRLFEQLDFGHSLVNSVFLASVTAALATLVSAMGGYALARYEFRGRRLFTAMVLGAVVIPAPLLLAPAYQLLFELGLLDTYAGLILPAIAPAFGVYLFRQYTLRAVPVELIESARIDGSGEFRTFFVIALPLARPMIGTFLMITFLGVWNNYIWPQVVLQSPSKFPLSVAVAQLKGVYYQDYGLQMAGTAVAILPVVALCLVLQREFVSGLSAGAVKG